MQKLCHKVRAAIPKTVRRELEKREKKTGTISDILRKVLQFGYSRPDELCEMLKNEYILTLYAKHGVLNTMSVREDIKVSDEIYCFIEQLTKQLELSREQIIGRMCAVYIYYEAIKEQQQIERKSEKVTVPLKMPGMKTQTAFDAPMADIMNRVHWGAKINRIVETCAGSLGIQPLSYLDEDQRIRYQWIACDIDAGKLGYYLLMQQPDRLTELKKAYQACLNIINDYVSVPSLTKNTMDGIKYMMYGRLLADGYSEDIINAMLVQYTYWSTRPNARRGTALQTAYQSAYDNIDSVADMLTECELVEQDLMETLRQNADRTDTLLIIDPPYLLSRTAPYAHNSRDMEFHIRLADTLCNLGTKFVLFCRVSASRSSPRKRNVRTAYQFEDAVLQSFYEQNYQGYWYYDISIPSAGGTTKERIITNLPMEGMDGWKRQQ